MFIWEGFWAPTPRLPPMRMQGQPPHNAPTHPSSHPMHVVASSVASFLHTPPHHNLHTTPSCRYTKFPSSVHFIPPPPPAAAAHLTTKYSPSSANKSRHRPLARTSLSST